MLCTWNSGEEPSEARSPTKGEIKKKEKKKIANGAIQSRGQFRSGIGIFCQFQFRNWNRIGIAIIGIGIGMELELP